jgi:hypothetical protein
VRIKYASGSGQYLTSSLCKNPKRFNNQIIIFLLNGHKARFLDGIVWEDITGFNLRTYLLLLSRQTDTQKDLFNKVKLSMYLIN